MTETVLPTPQPTTFEELDQLQTGVAKCEACRRSPATHSVNFSVAILGRGKGGSVKSIRARKVCEACAVKIYSAIARGLGVL